MTISKIERQLRKPCFLVRYPVDMPHGGYVGNKETNFKIRFKFYFKFIKIV